MNQYNTYVLPEMTLRDTVPDASVDAFHIISKRKDKKRTNELEPFSLIRMPPSL